MINDMKSRKSRKVAVLGPIPRDQIITDDGERFEKYGCALYTAVALSALLEAGDTVVPISHVRREDEGPIKQILASFPNIDASRITSSADRGDRVELRYIGESHRRQWPDRYEMQALAALRIHAPGGPCLDKQQPSIEFRL